MQSEPVYRAPDPARLVDIGLLAQLRSEYRRSAFEDMEVRI
jgi:hypothetical protein